MRDYYFNVAGFGFTVRLSESLDINRLLPSFKSFYGKKGDKSLFRLTVGEGVDRRMEEHSVLIENSSTDIGHVRIFRTDSGYRVEMNDEGNHRVAIMDMNTAFTDAVICLDNSNRSSGNVFSTMIRMLYSQRILSLKGVAVHASSVYKNGKSFLFLGRSGTGKSTHSSLWMRYIDECQLLNDDNPVIRIINGRVIAYGTPWSGKTPCYKNLCFPIAGIIRLRQAGENRFCHLSDVDAFTALLPSCALLRGNGMLSDNLYTTLAQVVELVPVAWLDCRPDKEAALMCYNNIIKK